MKEQRRDIHSRDTDSRAESTTAHRLVRMRPGICFRLLPGVRRTRVAGESQVVTGVLGERRVDQATYQGDVDRYLVAVELTHQVIVSGSRGACHPILVGR